MKDTRCDWHDDQGSLCYSCHNGTPSQIPSQLGFCSYCHGANPK
jgi:hypothetical protein